MRRSAWFATLQGHSFGASSLKRGSILSCLEVILEAEEPSSTEKEENNDDFHADETRTGRSARLRR